MMRTETHTISSKGYAPLGDPDEYDLDYPLASTCRTRTGSLSVLTPKTRKFSVRFRPRRTQRSRVAWELCERVPRECSPPPSMYQRTNSEFESSRRLEHFVNSWEGVLEELEDDTVGPIRFRVSTCTPVSVCVP